MSKTRDTGFLANVINLDQNGNVSIVSGSTVLMSISSSGAITTTGVISGSNAANASLLNGTGSVGFTTTGSFTVASSSLSTRTTQIEQVYATTGSNSFRATQSITGSLTVTGQIIAQTLNVQQVTSSIVYSSGSNVFGCDINSRQTFTGSFYQTGSVAVFNSCLGIGLNNPTNRLEVQSGNIKLNAGASRCTSVLFGITGTDYGKIEYNDTDSSLLISTVGSGFSGYDLNLGTKCVTRLTISGNGNVGVNCCSPGYNLDICGFANINAEATANQGTVQTLRVSSNLGNAALTINSCSNNHYAYLTFAQGCTAKFEIGASSCGDPNYPSTLYITNNTQVGAANAAIRIRQNGVISFQCQLAIGAPSTVSGIKLLVCGGGDYNTLFTSDTNRSGWVIAQPGTSSPVASGLVLAGSCSFRFGTNSYYHLVMNQDGSTQIFNTAGNATNTFMPSGLLCTLCGVRFGTGATTLNNYEEGTWTPRASVGGWTSNANVSNAGWYTRIGNLVTVGGTLDWSGGSGTQSGTALITGLPFAANGASNTRNVGQFGAPAPGSIGFRCSGKGQMVIVSDPGQSTMYLIETFQDGTYQAYTHTPCLANAGTIYGFQLTYHI